MEKGIALVLLIVATLSLIAIVVFGDQLPAIIGKSGEVRTSITGTNIQTP